MQYQSAGIQAVQCNSLSTQWVENSRRRSGGCGCRTERAGWRLRNRCLTKATVYIRHQHLINSPNPSFFPRIRILIPPLYPSIHQFTLNPSRNAFLFRVHLQYVYSTQPSTPASPPYPAPPRFALSHTQAHGGTHGVSRGVAWHLSDHTLAHVKLLSMIFRFLTFCADRQPSPERSSNHRPLGSTHPPFREMHGADLVRIGVGACLLRLLMIILFGCFYLNCCGVVE